jgi:hypothetical protein
MENSTFLNWQIDNHLNWKKHIDSMFPKLSRTCYAIRPVFHIYSTDTLKHFSDFHSTMKYGVSFGGNSPNTKSIFSSQKKIIRIMVGTISDTLCQIMFKRLEILPLPCEYSYVFFGEIYC